MPLSVNRAIADAVVECGMALVLLRGRQWNDSEYVMVPVVNFKAWVPEL